MKMVQPGSTVVVVLIIMTVLMLCTMNGLKNRFLLQELVYKQQLYEQHFWAAEGLLQYGIALAQSSVKNDPSQNVERQRQWQLPFGDYQGMLCLTSTQNRIKVHAQIKDQQDKLLCTHSCCIDTVQVGDQQQRVIREWKMETQ